MSQIRAPMPHAILAPVGDSGCPALPVWLNADIF